jgi:phosphoribosylanthranilate isomerase
MITTPRMLFETKRAVQIAGVIDEKEMQTLLECGVDLIGFPLGAECGAGNAGESEAREIVGRIRPPAFGVVITYLGKADDVAALCGSVGAPAVQLHGDVGVEELRRLRDISPGLFVIKTLVVRGGEFERRAAEVGRFAPFVDAFLTDTFDASTGRFGATGKTHDWSVSRRIVEYSARPVMLAGGLTPDNVARAIHQVQPAGVDAHTGVEGAGGRKDRALVERFVAEARRAFASL